MNRSMKISVLTVAFAVLAFGAIVWNFSRPPRAYYLIQDVKQGSTKEEVISVLGDPTSIQDNGTMLVYTRPLSWGILYVHLDKEGTLTHYRYDK